MHSHSAKLKNNNISLVWIPSHSGIIFNEQVDCLAKEASQSGITIQVPRHYTDFFVSVNSKNKKIHNEYIINASRYKETQFFTHFFSSTDSKPWFYKHISSRYQITTVSRIRANHYSLAASLFRKNIVNSPSCSCSNVNEDFDHILWSCPKYDNERRSYKATLNRFCLKHKITPPTSIIEILKHPTKTITAMTTEFLRKSNLFI